MVRGEAWACPALGIIPPVLVQPPLLPHWPPRVEDLFGRAGPLVLEIGFGDGRFTLEYAQTHPDRLVLGAEVSAGSVARALKKLRKARLPNVRLYHGEGRFALRNLVPVGSLLEVIVNFPDPWPKKRHQENRLLQRDFFLRLATRLALGGRLLLTTDHEDYFRFALEEAQATGLYRIETPPPPEAHLRTKYALKWRAEGRRFYHAAFTLEGPPPIPWPPLPRYAMAHAILEGPLPQDLPWGKTVHREEGLVVVFLEALRGREGFYLLTRVEEEDLVQELLLEIRPSAHGIYAGISRFGHPLITPGVRRAVLWLLEGLEALGLKPKEVHA